MSRPIYLDANATTQPLPEVVEEVTRVSTLGFANPGSRHSFGRAARRVLEAARETIADVLTAEPDEVVFTSGGTESSNLALRGLARGGSGTLYSPEGEHPATTETLRFLSQSGWTMQSLPTDNRGLLDVPESHIAPDARPAIVTALLAHNETGVVRNFDTLAMKCVEQRIALHVDAVQAVGKIPVSFRELNATTLAFGAHKFHGPRGVGGLLVRRGVTLTPQTFGGHQENGLRPGTEPVPLIAGMAKALELWHADREAVTARLTELRDELARRLAASCEPVVIHGSNSERLPNTLSIAFPGVPGEALLVALDLEGVGCSLGSTCASGSTEPAPALLAMGVPREIALSTLRISLSRLNTREEIEDAAVRISQVVKRLRAESEG